MATIIKILLISLLLLPLSARGETIDGIAAIVNDDIITMLDVDKESVALTRELEKKPPKDPVDKTKIRASALNRLIDKTLVDQKIKELDIKVSEEEVRQSIEDVKKQNNLNQEALVTALAGQGLTFDQYRAQLKDQLERIRLMSQEVRAKIFVGEREVREYYEANKAKYGEEELYHARHIFFKLDRKADATELKRVMDSAAAVLKEVNAGKDFAELARKHSSDPAAERNGGDLGTFKKGEMLPEIESSVIAMKPGEISELVKTPSGFHIIKLEEKTKGTARPFEELKAEIEDMLYKKKSEERFNQWVSELRKGASIEIKQP
jgi:peptidyl-prolyl cis-trans isomerase SurA